MASKILTVFGATGVQGGSVIKTILADPVISKEYKLRGVTRDTSKPSSKALEAQGVELHGREALGHGGEVLKALAPARDRIFVVEAQHVPQLGPELVEGGGRVAQGPVEVDRAYPGSQVLRGDPGERASGFGDRPGDPRHAFGHQAPVVLGGGVVQQMGAGIVGGFGRFGDGAGEGSRGSLETHARVLRVGGV